MSGCILFPQGQQGAVLQGAPSSLKDSREQSVPHCPLPSRTAGSSLCLIHLLPQGQQGAVCVSLLLFPKDSREQSVLHYSSFLRTAGNSLCLINSSLRTAGSSLCLINSSLLGQQGAVWAPLHLLRTAGSSLGTVTALP